MIDNWEIDHALNSLLYSLVSLVVLTKKKSRKWVERNQIKFIE